MSTATLKLVTDYVRGLDLDLPDAFVADVEQCERLSTDLLAVDRGRLAEQVADILANGDDPADDPDVRRQVLHAQLEDLGLSRRLTIVAEGRLAGAINRHADALVAVLAAEVDRLDPILKAARNRLPAHVDLGDRIAASTLRGDQVAAFAQADEILGKLARIVKVWSLVTGTTGAGRGQYAPLVLADLDADQFDQLTSRNPLAAAYAGFPLSLATVEQFHERAANVTSERQRQRNLREADARRRAANMAGNRA